MPNPLGVTAVERDHDELAAIHREHGEALRRLCLRHLRSAADADDAVQEVLVRAWGALPSFDRSRPMWPWLATIARNVCTDVHRRRRTDERRRMPSLGAGPDADEGLLRADRDAVVREAVTRLPDRSATVLYLRDVAGWDYDEIAAHLDRKPGAARVAVTRARQQLRTQVEAVARTRGQWPLSGVFGGWLSRRRLPTRLLGRTPAGVDPSLGDLGGILASHGASAVAGAIVALGGLAAGLGGAATGPVDPGPTTRAAAVSATAEALAPLAASGGEAAPAAAPGPIAAAAPEAPDLPSTPSVSSTSTIALALPPVEDPASTTPLVALPLPLPSAPGPPALAAPEVGPLALP